MGLIFRGPVVAVAPISALISDDFSFSAARTGLLTTLPVLCFALMTPFASLFVGTAGANLATTVAFLGVGIGSIVRSAAGVEATIAGTVIMGAFITIGNVVIPVVIRGPSGPRPSPTTSSRPGSLASSPTSSATPRGRPAPGRRSSRSPPSSACSECRGPRRAPRRPR